MTFCKTKKVGFNGALDICMVTLGPYVRVYSGVKGAFARGSSNRLVSFRGGVNHGIVLALSNIPGS